MKSMMRRPSLALLDKLRKLMPYGGRSSTKAADPVPVSEFESPKLKIAGNPQFFPEEEPLPIDSPPTTTVKNHNPSAQRPQTAPSPDDAMAADEIKRRRVVFQLHCTGGVERNGGSCVVLWIAACLCPCLEWGMPEM